MSPRCGLVKRELKKLTLDSHTTLLLEAEEDSLGRVYYGKSRLSSEARSPHRLIHISLEKGKLGYPGLMALYRRQGNMLLVRVGEKTEIEFLMVSCTSKLVLLLYGCLDSLTCTSIPGSSMN